MEHDHGWASLDEEFILHIVRILSSAETPINVCRPATAILKKFVEADPLSAPGALASTSTGYPALPPGSVYRYGFQVVYDQMKKEPSLLETVVDRLDSAETAMAQYRFVNCTAYAGWRSINVLFSLMLINSLLSHANDTCWEEFIAELERLNVRRAVIVSK
jgi:engulfment/cell motility protein 1